MSSRKFSWSELIFRSRYVLRACGRRSAVCRVSVVRRVLSAGVVKP